MKRKEFFELMFAQTTGLVEVRCRQSKAQLFSRDFGQIQNFVKDHFSEDIWFGAATRKRKNGSKKGVFELSAFWVDLDSKDFESGREQALRRLTSFSFNPSIIVETGGGFHAYWVLENVTKATLQKEAYLKGLAFALGGDPACAEVARVLRVPGTWNYKYSPPRPVKIYSVSTHTYQLPDFNPWKQKIGPARACDPEFSDPAVDLDLEKFNLSDGIKRLIYFGLRSGKYRSRSEADQAVITALVRAGASDDEIRAVFQLYRIGEKYLEKGPSGDFYLANSIRNAKRFLQQQSRSHTGKLKPESEDGMEGGSKA